jgi:biopolymer transport protein ExbD
VQIDQLETGVRSLVQASQQAVVVIHVDVTVAHGQVVQVMDQLREADSVKIAIATKKQ